MKKYNNFINESKSVSIKLTDDDVEMFNSEPALQKLISDNKVSLLPPNLSYTIGDSDTINTLKVYFPGEFNIGEETENYMMEESKKSNKKMIKKYNSFISEEKKFRTGPASPDNPKCSSVEIDPKDVDEYPILKKLEDEGKICIKGDKAWYFKGDINTKSILTSDDHLPYGHDEENESVKIDENIFDELPGYKSKKVELSRVKGVIEDYIEDNCLSLNGITLEELINKIEGSVNGGDAGPR